MPGREQCPMLHAEINMKKVLFILGILGAAISPIVVSDVQAAGCLTKSSLTGICKDKCEDKKEIAATALASGVDNEEFDSACNNNQDCCVSQGDALCVLVAQKVEQKKQGNANQAEFDKCVKALMEIDITKANAELQCKDKLGGAGTVSTYVCKSACTGKTIDLPQTCSGNLKCCSDPPSAEKASAAAPAAAQNIKLTNPLDPQNTGVTFYTLIQKVISAFLGLVGGLALAVFMYAGIMWMTAGGDEKKVQTSKDAMKYAVMGLAMIMFAYAITSFVIDALTGSIASQQTQEVEYAEQQNLQ